MFEHVHQRLIPVRLFYRRVLNALVLAFVILAVWLIIGMLGYHYWGHLRWVDSFVNASMILGGMGPVDVLTDDTAKIFAGCYAIFSGVMFLSSIAIFFAPILHRFLHRIHLDDDK
jgi:hypothetical protein